MLPWRCHVWPAVCADPHAGWCEGRESYVCDPDVGQLELCLGSYPNYVWPRGSMPGCRFAAWMEGFIAVRGRAHGCGQPVQLSAGLQRNKRGSTGTGSQWARTADRSG